MYNLKKSCVSRIKSNLFQMLLQSLPSCRRIALTLLLCACFSAVSGSDELDKLMKLLIDGLTDLAHPTADNSDDYHPGLNLIG
ncbi:hypothetical protein PoB_006046100 [Plakobranchus ocellatus]|uniref:Uncharacterized protein n=1 Tax=Plakobranchus ocellatus TaxID=259542 RepID=A0AAV4CQ03_9GAST|nr:hypothetical protein PoB_006046100 [Plakobranchus ocellatus]